MDLQLSTPLHSQIDGQSEVTIRVLENFLRLDVELHPHTWRERLILEEFATRNSINMSTGCTLFFLNFGEHPTLPKHL